MLPQNHVWNILDDFGRFYFILEKFYFVCNFLFSRIITVLEKLIITLKILVKVNSVD